MAQFKRKPMHDHTKITLSPSAINTFYASPYKWWLTYHEGFNIDASVHLVKGSAVHYALENIFEGRLWVGDENYQEQLMSKAMREFEKEWNPQALDELELTEEELTKHRNDAVNMIKVFIDRMCTQIASLLISGHAKSAGHGLNLLKPKFRELYIKDEELLVGGYIDCIIADREGHTTIIDYKTSNKFKGKMTQEYARQLAIYAYLYKKKEGVNPAWVGINYLRFGETYYIHVDDDLVKWAESEIKYVRDFINSHPNEEDYLPPPEKITDEGHVIETTGFKFIVDKDRKLLLSPYNLKPKKEEKKNEADNKG